MSGTTQTPAPVVSTVVSIDIQTTGIVAPKAEPVLAITPAIPTFEIEPEKPAEPEQPAIEDLGLLDIGRTKVLGITLPSIAEGIIVQYHPLLIITCSLPSRKYKILVSSHPGSVTENDSAEEAFNNYAKVTVDSPPLLLSMHLVDVPQNTAISDKVEAFKLYAHYKQKKSAVWGCPYLISNMHEDGAICFGHFEPNSLREALNTFWSSPFNKDLIGQASRIAQFDQYMDAATYIRQYKKMIYAKQKWENLTPIICGAKFWASPVGAEAVLVTASPALLKHIPRKYWRKFNDTPIIIARVKQEENGWLCESGNYKFKLDKKNLVIRAD